MRVSRKPWIWMRSSQNSMAWAGDAAPKSPTHASTIHVHRAPNALCMTPPAATKARAPAARARRFPPDASSLSALGIAAVAGGGADPPRRTQNSRVHVYAEAGWRLNEKTRQRSAAPRHPWGIRGECERLGARAERWTARLERPATRSRAP